MPVKDKNKRMTLINDNISIIGCSSQKKKSVFFRFLLNELIDLTSFLHAVLNKIVLFGNRKWALYVN